MPPLLDRPIFIIGCNRSGTTLLFNMLSRHPRVWSNYVEAQEVFHRHLPIDPVEGERVAVAPPADTASAIERELYDLAHNKEYFMDMPVLRFLPRKAIQRPLNRLYKRPPIRLVEKTPANSLRIPMLSQTFPDARFVLLVRRGEDVVSSLMEGWKNWSGTGTGPFTFSKWHYLVPPGWQEMRLRPLAEICAFQWIESVRMAWEDLRRCRPGGFLQLNFEALLADPTREYGRLMEYCELPPSAYFTRALREVSRRAFTTGGTPPRKDKWRELHGREIDAVREMLKPVNALFYDD